MIRDSAATDGPRPGRRPFGGHLPFRMPGQVRGLVYVERTQGNVAGPYRAAEIALLAMLTNVVAIAAVEAERLRAAQRPCSGRSIAAGLAAVITGNPEMLRILKLIERVADTPARVSPPRRDRHRQGAHREGAASD